MAGVAAVLLAVGVWVVATRGRSQPPTGASAVDALVAATVPKVEHAVGLRFKRPPRVEVRSREQVRQFLETQFNDPRQQRDIAGTSTALKLLGLIPDTLDLRHEEEALFTEQIAGFYDPKTKVLYWIAGEDTTAMLDEVIPHELVHALQDQYVNLDSIENAEGNDDRTMAAQAVFEGQAFYEQLAIAEPGVSLANQLPGLYGKIREAIRENRAKMPQYTAAPMVVQEVTIFPYLSGIEFVRRYEVHHPGGVPFDALPVSTQQVLHEDAYFGTPQALPVAVTLPPPRTGTVAYVNTMGEFQTRLFLFQHLDDQNASVRGAAAWVGDRYEVIDLKDGPALVWVTLLDSPVDAAQFVDLLDQTAHNRFGAPTSLHVYTKGARTVTITPVAVGGHPGVLYTDAPAASDLPLLDPATITTP